jgi:hypothetical protein
MKTERKIWCPLLVAKAIEHKKIEVKKIAKR